MNLPCNRAVYPRDSLRIYQLDSQLHARHICLEANQLWNHLTNLPPNRVISLVEIRQVNRRVSQQRGLVAYHHPIQAGSLQASRPLSLQANLLTSLLASHLFYHLVSQL